MPRYLTAAGLATLTLVVAAPPALSVSFDCRHVAAAPEIAICGDSALSALDDRMARTYFALLAGAPRGEKSDVRSEQRSWLTRRDACGADTRCIAREYRLRIRDLERSSRTAAVAHPAQTAERQPGTLRKVLSAVTPAFLREEAQPAEASNQAQQQRARGARQTTPPAESQKDASPEPRTLPEAPPQTAEPKKPDKPAQPRIVHEEPRVVLVRPRIVRERPPRAIARDERPQPAAVREETPAARQAGPPLPAALAIRPHRAPVAPVENRLKSRFDTAYGDLPSPAMPAAPTLQSRRAFDPSRFDIFQEPPGS